MVIHWVLFFLLIILIFYLHYFLFGLLQRCSFFFRTSAALIRFHPTPHCFSLRFWLRHNRTCKKRILWLCATSFGLWRYPVFEHHYSNLVICSSLLFIFWSIYFILYLQVSENVREQLSAAKEEVIVFVSYTLISLMSRNKCLCNMPYALGAVTIEISFCKFWIK